MLNWIIGSITLLSCCICLNPVNGSFYDRSSRRYRRRNGAAATRNRKPIGRNWTGFKRRSSIELQRREDLRTGNGEVAGRSTEDGSCSGAVAAIYLTVN